MQTKMIENIMNLDLFLYDSSSTFESRINTFLNLSLTNIFKVR